MYQSRNNRCGSSEKTRHSVVSIYILLEVPTDFPIQGPAGPLILPYEEWSVSLRLFQSGLEELYSVHSKKAYAASFSGD